MTNFVRLGLSPTKGNLKLGPLRTHIYNLAIALAGWEWGLKNKWVIIRIDDTNTLDSNYGVIKELMKMFSERFSIDLWENLIVKQSERNHIYSSFFSILERKWFLLPEGGAYKFDLEKFVSLYGSEITIYDMLKWEIRVSLKSQENFFIRRGDGTYLYNFASPIDDALLGISHIVRGNDKINSAIMQEVIKIALGLKSAQYVHLPLLRSLGGTLNSSSYYKDFLNEWYIQEAINSYLFSSWYGDPEIQYPHPESFFFNFDIKRIHKKDSLFDLDKLKSLNTKFLKSISSQRYVEAYQEYLLLNNRNDLIKLLDKTTQDFILKWRKDFSWNVKIMTYFLTKKTSFWSLNVSHLKRLDEIKELQMKDVKQILSEVKEPDERKYLIESIRFSLTWDIKWLPLDNLIDIFKDEYLVYPLENNIW